MPSEYTKLAEECSRCEHDRVWICKPVGQSQGKGIFLFRVRINHDSTNLLARTRQMQNLTFLEIKRSYIRQCSSGSKIHRESISDRRLQIRSTTIRVRTLLSAFDDILV